MGSLPSKCSLVFMTRTVPIGLTGPLGHRDDNVAGRIMYRYLWVKIGTHAQTHRVLGRYQVPVGFSKYKKKTYALERNNRFHHVRFPTKYSHSLDK
jgi:hypothetical protein